MKKSIITLSLLLACSLLNTSNAVTNQKDRFEDVSVNIPTLSHDYYLGKGSGATHFWHGDNKDMSFTPTGGNDAFDGVSNKVHPELTAHSKKMKKGIFSYKEKFYQVYGYGLTSPMIVDGDNGLLILDPVESVDKMKNVMDDFRKVTGNKKPVAAIMYSHWHPDHYAGVRGIEGAEKALIIAHDTFMTNVVKGSMGGTGPALGFRVDYSLGTLLSVNENGRINGGLGPDFEINEHSLIAPNTLVKGKNGQLAMTIAGVKVEFKHVPSEASDEITAYFPDFNMLFGSEVIQGESFPNLHTIRGTQYRDPSVWFPGVDTLLEYNAQAMMVSHGRPVVGSKHVDNTLTSYRDAIQYTYDQSIKAINNGATQEDLIREIKLPKHLVSHPWLGDFYGSIRHAAKQIFVGEMGWFDGDPTTLNPTYSVTASQRYVSMVGGKDEMMNMATKACDSGDFQWCAELATHAVRVDLEDMEPRLLKAIALRELAYRETNNNWRNWYLTSAQELDGTIDYSKKINLQAPDLMAEFEPSQLVGAMRFSLNAQRSQDKHFTIAFEFGDYQETHALEIRRSVAQFHKDYQGQPKATVKLTKPVFLGLLVGKIDFVQAVKDGYIQISGDAKSVSEFFGLFDKPAENPKVTLR
ncbi:alkyl/aryl-sulfatase [Colwellia psychrerythraea]|uniref:Metallo-beta-lactamase family protein n=1 Tax=Colwellia psychrerythraea (strain 34H / ATCC BAA-681) TaxID=167879 RepID=Q486J1_COLP3|nr:alkyl sulfatase dimerization domain-containing protein [Colwellia psychrerythraea]AAZ26986.1 metallo-beta-lactamase family protein [Colwellia psychrerythraea 34H]